MMSKVSVCFGTKQRMFYQAVKKVMAYDAQFGVGPAIENDLITK